MRDIFNNFLVHSVGTYFNISSDRVMFVEHVHNISEITLFELNHF